jgi:DNA-binding transcriptional LysR family regulator
MLIIDAMDFHGVDLNLLVSLRVLLVERHVTRAAEKLGITQPAMSASLARLRALFHDQLLVRGPKGLVLTPRAEQVLGQLNQAMAVIEQVVAQPAEFVAETSHRTFNLAGTDFIELFLLPSLMAALASEAPNLQIVYRAPWAPTLSTIAARLASGEIDLGVGYLPDPPKELIKRTVFHDSFVCVARRGHPLLRDGSLSLDRYIELRHVQVLPGDGTMYAAPIDTALAAMGLVRKVALWEPTFLVSANVVAGTDLISTVPRCLASHIAQALPIAIYDLPLPPSELEFAMYWHRRSQDDPGHKWLRERVAALLRAWHPALPPRRGETT